MTHNAFGAYLMFIIGLAIAGLVVYYVLMHRDQFASLWNRATHPPTPTEETQPGQ